MIAAWSARERWLVGLLAALLAGWAYWSLALDPLLNRMEAALRTRAELAERVSAARALEGRQAELAARRAALAARLEELSRRLPGADAPRVVILALEERATAAGLRVDGVAFGARQADGDWARLPVEVRVSGTYPGLRAFVGQLESSPLRLRVEGIEVLSTRAAGREGAGGQAAGGTLTAVLRLSIVVDPQAPPRPPAPAPVGVRDPFAGGGP